MDAAQHGERQRTWTNIGGSSWMQWNIINIIIDPDPDLTRSTLVIVSTLKQRAHVISRMRCSIVIASSNSALKLCDRDMYLTSFQLLVQQSISNPECIPLEMLKLHIKSDGVIIAVEALSPKWTEKRYFLHYEAPEIYDENGSEIVGYKEYWIELINYIIEDLTWLLNLPFYRFWSNVIYNTSIIDTLVSFLQEAPPFYALETFPAIPEMLEALEKLRYNVLMIFIRLVTNKESLTEYIQHPYLGNLLYNNYIFTVPIIFDLCQLYGRENDKLIEKILHNIFSMQPLYNDDLEKSVPCLIKALKNVEQKFEDCPTDTMEAVALSERGCVAEMTLYKLEGLILYVLDLSSTLVILLKCNPPIVSIFHREDFMNKILSIYGNTISQMYKTLDRLAHNDKDMPKYIELKHYLDVTRVEILNLYRTIVYEPISNIQKKMDTITEDEVRNFIDQYLYSLTNAISEKEFIIDYHKFYPIDYDLEVVSKFYPDVDYILNSLYVSIGDTKIPTNISSKDITISNAGFSGVQDNQQNEHCNNVSYRNKELETISNDSDQLMSHILKVKEILCDYDENFIQICLKHYDYNVESVINAVLENTLPSNLKKLNGTLPHIVPDSLESPTDVNSAINDQRLNILDNDELHLPALSKMYRKERKEKYKDANEMLNDKSWIDKSIYGKYNIIDEVDDYDDEYDDTYDSHNIRSALDSTEIEPRPFTTPRVLCTSDKSNANSEDETEIENEKSIQNIDHFIQNPMEMRIKMEQRKQLKGNQNSHNVVDKFGNQEQNKEILIKGHKKNTYKDSQSNHNRRTANQMKKRQGMIPF
ncbi:activating signal cointegrator 1 complex subunit 2 isoform X2 [Harpegnathos saltator]|uniref:activating signal cointegrator 1 complex subunit 2 isoform X2 n=1 Tax=Harpegnathos saltator TaxID=610380 RepID=UPI00058ED978|nr:activating signal cointegrator 1 complex subunit 2 isoform X2 [Harpegnathos saltator]